MPPDTVRIEVTLEGEGFVYVVANQQTGGMQLVSARLKAEDVGDVLASAVRAYYATLPKIAGVRP